MILQEKCSHINNSHDWNNCRKMFPYCSLYFDIWVKCSEINHNSGNNLGKVFTYCFQHLPSTGILKKSRPSFPIRSKMCPNFFPWMGKFPLSFPNGNLKKFPVLWITSLHGWFLTTFPHDGQVVPSPFWLWPSLHLPEVSSPRHYAYCCILEITQHLQQQQSSQENI